MQSLLLMVLGAFLYTTSIAQDDEVKSIKSTIKSFVQAGDERDVEQLEQLLDPHYRIVMNRLFGSEQVMIMEKKDYLSKISSGEFGGDKRKASFENLVVNGLNATVKVKLEGKKMTFVSILNLVKDKEGQWKLVSDLPTVI